MGATDVNLAELVGSRICHDLISPIGAVTNGLELLDMVGSARGPEMDLITGSVASAGARIRFFRVAFGAASDHPLGRTEISQLLSDIQNAGRVRVHWAPSDAVPRSLVKLAFLATMCCESAMPLGGDVQIASQDGKLDVTGSADRLSIDSALWKGLQTGQFETGLTPAQVQFALLAETARAQGRRITLETATTRIALRL